MSKAVGLEGYVAPFKGFSSESEVRREMRNWIRMYEERGIPYKIHRSGKSWYLYVKSDSKP